MLFFFFHFHFVGPSSPIIEELTPVLNGLNVSWKSDVTSKQDKYAVVYVRNDTGISRWSRVCASAAVFIFRIFSLSLSCCRRIQNTRGIGTADLAGESLPGRRLSDQSICCQSRTVERATHPLSSRLYVILSIALFPIKLAS